MKTLILADLPGYGFAQASKEARNRWGDIAETYIKSDPLISRLCILWDSRHGPTSVDQSALEFLSAHTAPVLLVMTKFDQLKTQSERVKRAREVESFAAKHFAEKPQVVWVSSKSNQGMSELVRALSLG